VLNGMLSRKMMNIVKMSDEYLKLGTKYAETW
jgi:hypothetical protein